MIVIPSDAHNTVFGRILKDIFHFSVLYYSIIAFRLKALSTNQKDWTVFNIFLVPFFLMDLVPAFYLENLLELCHLGHEGGSVLKMGSGCCIPCL